jgi:LPLT family lysophospholipid transporter-like MFS transporter
MKPPTTNRNYGLLLLSQFLGAFGDNVILAIILGQLTNHLKAGLITESQLRSESTIYTSILFVPYVLLAPLAGFFGDRFPKTRALALGNGLKLVGSVVAMSGIWAGHIWEGIGYFIVGIGSCVYGPGKYGILPEILPRERLVKANGTVELLTLLAILAGPIAGGAMIDKLPVAVCYGILLAIFLGSLALNLIMTPTPSNPNIRVAESVGEFKSHFGDLLHSARLWRVLLGTAMFWLCGAVLKINFQPWGLNVLHLQTNLQIALLGLWLGIGIMVGSVLAGQLHKVGDLRITRYYGWGMAALLLVISQFAKPGLTVILMLIVVGIAAGLFLIPLNAALQAESHPDKLGKTIAVQNFSDNLAMIVGGGFVFACVKANISPAQIFAIFGVILALLCLTQRFPAKTESTKP